MLGPQQSLLNSTRDTDSKEGCRVTCSKSSWTVPQRGEQGRPLMRGHFSRATERREGFRDGQQALRSRWGRSGTCFISATRRTLTKCPLEAVSTFQQAPGRKLTNLQASKCVLLPESLMLWDVGLSTSQFNPRLQSKQKSSLCSVCLVLKLDLP